DARLQYGGGATEVWRTTAADWQGRSLHRAHDFAGQIRRRDAAIGRSGRLGANLLDHRRRSVRKTCARRDAANASARESRLPNLYGLRSMGACLRLAL